MYTQVTFDCSIEDSKSQNLAIWPSVICRYVYLSDFEALDLSACQHSTSYRFSHICQFTWQNFTLESEANDLLSIFTLHKNIKVSPPSSRIKTCECVWSWTTKQLCSQKAILNNLWGILCFLLNCPPFISYLYFWHAELEPHYDTMGRFRQQQWSNQQ